MTTLKLPTSRRFPCRLCCLAALAAPVSYCSALCVGSLPWPRPTPVNCRYPSQWRQASRQCCSGTRARSQLSSSVQAAGKRCVPTDWRVVLPRPRHLLRAAAEWPRPSTRWTLALQPRPYWRIASTVGRCTGATSPPGLPQQRPGTADRRSCPRLLPPAPCRSSGSALLAHARVWHPVGSLLGAQTSRPWHGCPPNTLLRPAVATAQVQLLSQPPRHMSPGACPRWGSAAALGPGCLTDSLVAGCDQGQRC